MEMSKDTKYTWILISIIWLLFGFIAGSLKAVEMNGCIGEMRPFHFLNPGYFIGCATWTPIGNKIYGSHR